jgi:hypothetical protein
MSQIEFRGVTFSVSDQDQRASCFVLGVRKSGSTVLNNMVTALAKVHAYGVVDFGMMFQAGMIPREWRFEPSLASLIRGGNVYLGFRDFPAGLRRDEKFVASPKILMVRDPRDALISEYFSNAYSHPVPKEGFARELMLKLRGDTLSVPIESSVLKSARFMAATMREFAPLLSDPLLKLYRYEDVIFEKRRLLQDISNHFGWPIDAQAISQILKWADVVPAEERPTEFIRRVHPGDYLNKLSKPAIGKLNTILADTLKTYGYAW